MPNAFAYAFLRLCICPSSRLEIADWDSHKRADLANIHLKEAVCIPIYYLHQSLRK